MKQRHFYNTWIWRSPKSDGTQIIQVIGPLTYWKPWWLGDPQRVRGHPEGAPVSKNSLSTTEDRSSPRSRRKFFTKSEKSFMEDGGKNVIIEAFWDILGGLTGLACGFCWVQVMLGCFVKLVEGHTYKRERNSTKDSSSNRILNIPVFAGGPKNLFLVPLVFWMIWASSGNLPSSKKVVYITHIIHRRNMK